MKQVDPPAPTPSVIDVQWAFAVLGDVVNVTSRIETLTHQLDSELLSDAVVSAVNKAKGSQVPI